MTVPDRSQGTGALILAAGRSVRFGADKRLATLPCGRSMLETTIAAYTQVFDPVRVVLRRDDEEMAQRLALAFPELGLIASRRSAEGMGGSLADGIAACDDLEFLFVGLGDMPFVAVPTLAALRDEASACRDAELVLRPRHRGAAGHPVGFGRALMERLREEARGDQGARALLSVIDRVRWLDTDDPGVLRDVDNASDITATRQACRAPDTGAQDGPDTSADSGNHDRRRDRSQDERNA